MSGLGFQLGMKVTTNFVPYDSQNQTSGCLALEPLGDLFKNANNQVLL